MPTRVSHPRHPTRIRHILPTKSRPTKNFQNTHHHGQPNHSSPGYITLPTLSFGQANSKFENASHKDFIKPEGVKAGEMQSPLINHGLGIGARSGVDHLNRILASLGTSQLAYSHPSQPKKPSDHATLLIVGRGYIPLLSLTSGQRSGRTRKNQKHTIMPDWGWPARVTSRLSTSHPSQPYLPF